MVEVFQWPVALHNFSAYRYTHRITQLHDGVLRTHTHTHTQISPYHRPSARSHGLMGVNVISYKNILLTAQGHIKITVSPPSLPHSHTHSMEQSSQPVKKSPTFHATRRFITAFKWPPPVTVQNRGFLCRRSVTRYVFTVRSFQQWRTQEFCSGVWGWGFQQIQLKTERRWIWEG